MSVTPITVTTVNWEVASHRTGDPQLIAKLTKLGVKKYDPGALAVYLNGNIDLTDSWALKFSHIGFLVTDVDPHIVSNLLVDCAQITDDSYVLCGSGDKWFSQILKESVLGNDPMRIMLFNKCFEHLLNTSLKAMFYNYERKHIPDMQGRHYYVLVRKVK